MTIIELPSDRPADRFNRAEFAPGFAIVVVDGRLVLTAASKPDAPTTLARGSTALLPRAAGAVTAEGRAELLVARPPVPR